MKKLAIQGHKTRSNEVIKLLKMLGGKNIKNLCGSSPMFSKGGDDVYDNYEKAALAGIEYVLNNII